MQGSPTTHVGNVEQIGLELEPAAGLTPQASAPPLTAEMAVHAPMWTPANGDPPNATASMADYAHRFTEPPAEAAPTPLHVGDVIGILHQQPLVQVIGEALAPEAAPNPGAVQDDASEHAIGTPSSGTDAESVRSFVDNFAKHKWTIHEVAQRSRTSI